MGGMAQCSICGCYSDYDGMVHEYWCPDHDDNDPYRTSYEMGAAAAFGIMGMAFAIADREADKYWEEVEKEQDEMRELRALQEQLYWWVK